MPDTSDRFKLPLLAAGQAQKEITHNEALMLADMLLHSVVVAVAPGSVPSAPLPGQCWIVGNSPSGAWAGQSGAIAGWSAGGWRFVAPIDGMAMWSLADSLVVRRNGGVWVAGMVTATSLKIGGNQVVGARAASIANVSGGSVIDVEARAVINSILVTLRSHGLIAP
jgi:Protein of unknown function (DUF2793)